MPAEDNITNRNFNDLLKSEVQYVIPFFQRNYVWERRNWEALYRDIKAGLDLLGDEEPVRGYEHFFGPIVVRESPRHPNPSLKAFDVIDGQQRITTVYLMLAYFRRRLSEIGIVHPRADEHRDNIGVWLENSNPRPGHDYDILKILSFKNDRLATWFAVRGKKNPPKTPGYADDLNLHIPEGKIPVAFEKWLKGHFGKMDANSIWRWAEALTTCLQVVWIPLKEKDNPQAIFESLNDRGTPLSAIDLLVNYLFRPIIDAGDEDYESLHNNQWLTTQTEIERWEGSFEEYLRCLLSIGASKMVGKDRRMYTFFKQQVAPGITNEQAHRWLYDIAEFSPLYGRILGKEFAAEHPAIDRLLADIRDTDMHSCRPFLLAVLKEVEAGELSAKEAEQILRETLTLLVRCKILQRRTTQYDTLFPPLLGRMQLAPNNMVAALHKEIKNAQFWVSDQEFEEGLVKLPLYRRRQSDLAFLRFFLREIDKRMTLEDNASNELPDYGILDTVEHIAPQTCNEAWLAETGCADENEYDYTLPKDTLGNLCLRSRKMNSGMGQSSFAEKKRSFSNAASVLAIEISEREGPWNKDAIEKRSRDLAEHAMKIWAWSPAGRG